MYEDTIKSEFVFDYPKETIINNDNIINNFNEQSSFFVQKFPNETKSFYLTYRDIIDNALTELEVPYIYHTGHSTVYKGFSKRYNKTVAIKIIHKNKIPESCRETFLPRELFVTKSANHPNLAKCLYISQPNDSKIVIISEYYNNGTLQDLINRNKRLPEKVCSIIFRQLIEAVNYLHQRGVVHRDIKPLNILFDENKNLKLVDFGFAREMKLFDKSTSFCGSPNYTTINVLLQKPYCPYAGDWYSIGVVLYVMLTGEFPMNPVDRMRLGIDDVRFYSYFPSGRASSLLNDLLKINEEERAGYKECMESEFMKFHNGEWQLSDNKYIYKML
ncbi:AT25266p [Strongyloides ratti]|uniref:AT25266p n=1 Tax=Strongyloides ratti TaxID=34506 RepID=A0A090LCI5_STRRB|nr:AT25266p [Strongyloides ratti]CEF67511.1 AT25266p [Strongyloides ratti]